MVLYLISESGTVIYLRKNNEYSIGRKECDILLQNDQSISRKHAVITVKNNKATVCDAGSKYNTFIDGAKIESQIDIPLISGNVIRFGMINSIYTFQENKIVTTLSNIKRLQKAVLKSQIEFLNGSVVDNWSLEITHVTIEEILLTVKVLCAIIMGIPIVNLKFWEDYVDRVRLNQLPPNCNEYQPPCSEIILNQANVKLEYTPERKNLFSNKIFVFPTQAEKEKMIELIKCAGGEATSWDNEPFTKESVNNSSKEHLIIATDTKLDESLLEMVKYLTELGKRTIPLQEIALAVIQDSCEKDCNPSFNRTAAVFQMNTQNRSSAKLLAPNTETQSQFVIREIKTEDISTESTVASVIESTQNVEQTFDAAEASTSFKREGENLEKSTTKKFRVDAQESLSFRKKSSDENVKPVESEAGPGKGLFAFKHAKVVEPPKNAQMVINPFTKKRKAEPVESPFVKKSAAETDSKAPVTSTPISSDNRFSNILKSKNTPSIFKKTKKSQPNVTTTNSEISESAGLHLYLSTVKPIDETIQDDFDWLSKSKPGKTVPKEKEELEIAILEYIESFKHTVVIEEEPLVVRKDTSMVDNNNDSSMCNKNFKKFKKVKPIRLQTTIIPESSYINITCDGKKSDTTVEENSNEED